MIQSIVIKGFQSHVNSELLLSPGLTVITGPTDSGKTAIIRAVRWVVFGEPQGEAFINESVGEAIVQITLDDGTVITKGRKKGGRTVYHLVPKEGKSQIFEQADVPLEVTAALGINRQVFGDFETTLNIAFQLDAPFLISEPASAGAKVLGKIAGTEIVDQAIKSVAKDTYAARQDKLRADNQIEEKTKDLKSYEGIDQLKEQVEACETLLQQFEQQSQKLENLSTLKHQKTRLDQHLAVLEAKLQQYVFLMEAEQHLKDAETGAQRLQLLSELAGKHGQLDSAIIRYQEELSLYVGLGQASKQLTVLDHLLVTADKLLEYQYQYAQHLETLKKTEAVLVATKDLDVAAADLADVEHGLQMLNAWLLLSRQYQTHIVVINDREKLLTALGNINQAEPLLSRIDDQRSRLERLKELQSLFRIKNDTYTEAGKKAAAATAAVAAQEKILRDLWAEVDICPLCNQPILKGDYHGHKNSH